MGHSFSARNEGMDIAQDMVVNTSRMFLEIQSQNAVAVVYAYFIISLLLEIAGI